MFHQFVNSFLNEQSCALSFSCFLFLTSEVFTPIILAIFSIACQLLRNVTSKGLYLGSCSCVEINVLGTCSACLSKPFEGSGGGKMLTNVCCHFLFLFVHARKHEMNYTATATLRILVHLPCDLFVSFWCWPTQKHCHHKESRVCRLSIL